MKVDELAQEIRRVDGDNTLGAGALAESLLPFITESYRDYFDAGWEWANRLRTVSGADIDAGAHALERGTDLSLSWEELCTIAELVLRSRP